MAESTGGQGDLIWVMIVDDHPLVRDGLKMLLLTAPDMTLAAEASSGEEALRLCAKMDVDIVLMDLKMPGMGGVKAIRALHENYPHIGLIALTSFVDKKLVEDALQAGAIGYILKNISPAELTTAIRSANRGQLTISSAAAHYLVQASEEKEQPDIDGLTSREREVLALMALGMSNSEIGVHLVIQPTTVNFHVGNILSKLDVSNRTEAVALAVQKGFV